MPAIQLLGHIWPPAAVLNIKDMPLTTWSAPDIGLDMQFGIHIEENSVRIECEVNKWDQEKHFLPVYMRALDLARAAVDLAVFDFGVAMTVVIETLVTPSGEKSQILLHDTRLSVLSTSVKNTDTENNYDRVFRLLVTNIASFRALHDLTEAISETHVSPIACGRAVEGIRHAIAPNAERKKAWRKMNDALNLERSYIELITDTSTGPRHGNTAHVTGAVCVEITNRGWTIMNRYFEYLKRGSHPLPESEFPILR
jgi:hypothetical protein